MESNELSTRLEPPTIHITNLTTMCSTTSPLIKIYSVQQKWKSSVALHGGLLCLRDLGGRGRSLEGFLNKSKNIGLYFLKILLDTAKFLSKRSTLLQNPSSKWDIASQDFIFLINSVRLKKAMINVQFPYTMYPINIYVEGTYTQNNLNLQYCFSNIIQLLKSTLSSPFLVMARLSQLIIYGDSLFINV